MKKLSGLILTGTILVALAACGAKKDEGGLTAQDNKELNEASEMLDASPDSLVASDNVALGNGEQAADSTAESTNAAEVENEVARGNSE